MIGAEEEDIDAQIAALQAKKAARDVLKAKEAARAEAEERKILVGATPTKKPVIDKIKEAPTSPSRRLGTAESLGPKRAVPATSFYGVKPNPPPRQSLPSIPSAASRMSMGLASMRRVPSADAPRPAPMRSSSFGSRPPSNAVAGPSRPSTSGVSRNGGFTSAGQLPRGESQAGNARQEYEDELEVDDTAPRRDGDSLEILEKLQFGPGEFGKDPEGEDVWAFLEPNSKIRLAERKLPHEDLQSFLYGRHLVSPSQLYSVIRLSRDGATYDVPVEGDWVIIAVVAERGEVRVSGSKPSSAGGADEADSSSEEDGFEGGSRQAKAKAPPSKANGSKAKGKPQPEQKQRKPKKYINLKLCALPPRSSKSNAASGDALLQLLLFEADHVVYSETKDGEKKAVYKGGSGGAYEKWCTLAPGDVVGLLNPRVLRPLKAGKAAPHPLTLPLALNPTGQDGIIHIGQARDLGCCSAQQRDGNRCRSWVDLRQGAVCEYHISQALNRGRAGRAEFSTAQSSFASTRIAARAGSGGPALSRGVLGQKKSEGLLPSSGAQPAPRGADNGGGGATYVVGGRTINTAGQTPGAMKGFGAEHLGEKLGRGRAEKRKRKIEEKEAEEVLMKRLTQDGGTAGGRYLKAIEASSAVERTGAGGNASGKRKVAERGEESKKVAGEGEEKQRTFGAHIIQKIGFDPHRLGMSEREKEERGECIRKLMMTGKGFDERARVKRVNVRPPPEAQAAARRVGAGSVEAERDRGHHAGVGSEEGVDGEDDMVDL